MMPRNTRGLLGATTVLVLALAAVMMTGRDAAQGQGRTMPVVIEGPLPVPVEGSVAVSGTPTVNVGSLPPVSLASGASVIVGNGSGAPVPIRVVDDAEPVVVRTFVTLEVGTTGTGASAPLLYTVPSDRRLIVEYVSCLGPELVPADHMSCGLVLSTSTFTAGVWVGATGPWTMPAPGLVSGPVKLYIEPGREVRATVSRNLSATEALYSVLMSGRLVPAP